MASIEVLDPCTSPQWLEFVERHTDAGIFHHPVWLRMLQATYGYRPFAVCMVAGGHIEAGIPFMEVRSFITGNRWLSVPFSDHCQPLLDSTSDKFLGLLLTFLGEKKPADIDKVEIRWNVGLGSVAFQSDRFVLHTLRMERDSDRVFSRFNKSTVQRGIKRALNEGVDVSQGRSADDLRTFYRLQVLTRKRLGAPAQPWHFFESSWTHVLNTGHGFLLLAKHQERTVAGAVFLTFKNKLVYKYGASDDRYWGSRPNHAIFWEAIQRGCREGYSELDFGRSERSNRGLIEFKDGWGTEVRPLVYTIIADKPPSKGVSTLDKLASTVIRHSPQVVCRLSGELLYRHFA